MARRQRTLEITDARALRAMAHGARQQIFDLLYGDGLVLTATQAAPRCGLSPSAMSYHLRALERWGIVERAPVDADHRERPWRAAATSLTLGARGGSKPVALSFAAQFIDDFRRKVERWAQSLEPADREHSSTLRRGSVWLTDEEAAALDAEIDASIKALKHGRTAARHPAGAVQRDFYWAMLDRPPAEQDDEAPTGTRQVKRRR